MRITKTHKNLLSYLSIIQIFIYLIIFNISKAQNLNQQLGLGLRYMSLDQPDDMVYAPTINYSINFNKELSISLSAGYINFSGTDNTLNIIPETRERIIIDLTAKFSIIKKGNSAWRIGVGPSLYKRKDEIVNSLSYEFNQATNNLIIKDYAYLLRNDWALGYNVFTEIELAATKKLSIIPSFGIINLNKQGLSSILALNAMFRF